MPTFGSMLPPMHDHSIDPSSTSDAERLVEPIEEVFLRCRGELLAFLRNRGAGEGAEDMLHEIWLRLPQAICRSISTPRSYLYRMASSLLIDAARQRHRSVRRDYEWADTNDLLSGKSLVPSIERDLLATEEVERILAAVAVLGVRPYRAFLRHRIDGLTQREVAAELAVSAGTVESDLRRVYHLIATMRRAAVETESAWDVRES